MWHESEVEWLHAALGEALWHGRNHIGVSKDMADRDEVRDPQSNSAENSRMSQHVIHLAMPGPSRDDNDVIRRGELLYGDRSLVQRMALPKRADIAMTE